MESKLIALDQQLFVFLNNLGSTPYDGFWLFLTKQTHWTPFFLVLLVVIYKKIGGKQTLYLLLVVALMITCTDQFTNLVKNNVQRLRPCNTSNLVGLIRVVKASDTFSFFSGHAANSMAAVSFLYFSFHTNFLVQVVVSLAARVCLQPHLLGLAFPTRYFGWICVWKLQWICLLQVVCVGQK